MNFIIFVFKDILRTVLLSSLCIVFLLALRITVFRSFSKKFNYYIWFVVVIKLLLPFTHYTFTFNTLKYQDTINKINLDSFNTVFTSNASILLVFWIAIVVVYLVYTVWKYINLKYLINDLSYDVDDEEISNLYESILKELNVSKDIKLKYSYEVETPAFFDSCVLLPPCDYTLKELEWIFRHELMHFKSKDLYIKYLMLFLKIVYWFNPLIYIMDKFMDLDCELYCDERVLKNRITEDKQEYALTIINSMRKGSNPSNKFVAGLHKKSDIKKRVSNMFNEKYRNGIFIALILCLLSSVTYLTFDYVSYKSLNHSIYKNFPLKKSIYSFHVDV